MSAPSLQSIMQTPQREFAGAKVLLFFDIYKKICTFDADLLILWSITDSKGKEKPFPYSYLRFQNMFAFHILQHGHLLDRDLVEFVETLLLRHSFIDKDSIEVLHVAQTNQLIDGRIIADISFVIGMSITPFFSCDTKERHIEHVGFIGINKRFVIRIDLLRHQVCLDGIGVDMVVNLC